MRSETRLWRHVADARHVPVAEVQVGSRMRHVDDDAVEALVARIERDGVLQPIVVTAQGALVAGAHRLQACRRLGLPHIPARVVELDAQAAELAEIEENLVRLDLTVLQRAEHVAAREDQLQALGQRAESGEQDPGGGGGMMPPPLTTKALARKTGCSTRTYLRLRRIGRMPAVVRALIGERGDELANTITELDALANLEEDQQLATAQLALDEGLRVRNAAERVRSQDARRDGRGGPSEPTLVPTTAEDPSVDPPGGVAEGVLERWLDAVEGDAHLSFPNAVGAELYVPVTRGALRLLLEIGELSLAEVVALHGGQHGRK